MKEAHYSIIQFLPVPDRMETINVGVVVVDVVRGQSSFRFVDSSKQFHKPGMPNSSFFEFAFMELQNRLEREISKASKISTLNQFRMKRSNNFRLTEFLPTFGMELQEESEQLFVDLVGSAEKQKRRTPLGTVLKRGLKEIGSLNLFDQKPETVSLPRYRLVLKPDLSIRRETLELIQTARFDDPKLGIEQAGKHALEGRALKRNLGHSLIVVGDFGNQPDDYFRVIEEDLAESNTALFRLDRIQALSARYHLH